MACCHNLDLFTATAGDLRQLLEVREITSVELVKLYLKQIASHNHDGMRLNAMISVASTDTLLEEARKLDVERAKTGPRSRMHGIPIILKDLITTPSFGLETTSGSFALKGLNASKDATIATLLREAGMLVIGKSNLSVGLLDYTGEITKSGEILKVLQLPADGQQWEASYLVDEEHKYSFSAKKIQTQSPYIKGGVDPKDQWMGHTATPAGSSSGSASGTAAGFAPLAIGTEADGSIVQPAIRAALYSMKGTVGDVNMVGTQSGGAAFDSAGPMAKSVEDCADIMDILLPGRAFRTHLKRTWKGVGIAYLNYETWQFPNEVCHINPEFDAQHTKEIGEALRKIENLGAKVVYDAPLPTVSEVVEKNKIVQMSQIARHQLRFVIERYLAIFDSPTMRTLKDLVEFNKENAEVELPPAQSNQKILENGLLDNMTDEQYANDLKHLRESMRDSVEKLLLETGTDVIMASGESLLPTVAALAGYPIASVPLGFSTYNGRPFGLEIMARNGEEGKIFEVMSAWEGTFPDARQPPPLLV